MVFSSLFERIRTGLRVAKASFGVLRREYWLLVFPVLYGVAWLAGAIGLLAGILLALVRAGYGLAAVDQVATVSEGQAETAVTALLVAASVLFMFVATAVATFFSAALVHSVGSLFAGEPTNLRDGLAGAWEARRTILAWGAVGTAVGLVFRALESREGTPARLARSIAGFAWFAMTFFIVPVIVFQDGGVRESMRNSVGLFRDTWGEVGGTTLGVGLVILSLAALVGGLGSASRWSRSRLPARSSSTRSSRRCSPSARCWSSTTRRRRSRRRPCTSTRPTVSSRRSSTGSIPIGSSHPGDPLRR